MYELVFNLFIYLHYEQIQYDKYKYYVNLIKFKPYI